MRTLFVSLSILLLSGSLLAKDPVLMTINGNPVSKSEFEYIYNKNNSNNVLDKKTLEEYVDLFVNFKLKVEEAKTQGIDTTEAFINELKGYRDQLTRPYLTDTKAEEDALKEAYERLKEDVEVSHILIRRSACCSEDTLAAWNKIREISKDCSMKTSAQLPKKHQKTSQQPQRRLCRMDHRIPHHLSFRNHGIQHTGWFNLKSGTNSTWLPLNQSHRQKKFSGRSTGLTHHEVHFTRR